MSLAYNASGCVEDEGRGVEGLVEWESFLRLNTQTSTLILFVASLSLVLNLWLGWRVGAGMRGGRLPKKRFVFVISLATADVAFALVVTAFAIAKLRPIDTLGGYIMFRFLVLGTTMVNASCLTYTALAICQFIAIRWPVFYRLSLSWRVCAGAVGLLWAGASSRLLLLLSWRRADVEELTWVLWVLNDAVSLGVFLSVGLVYAGTILALCLRGGLGEAAGAGPRSPQRVFLKLSGHLLVFAVSIFPFVLTNAVARRQGLQVFLPASDLSCFFAYIVRMRWIMWKIEMLLALMMLRSIVDPIVHLFSIYKPPQSQHNSSHQILRPKAATELVNGDSELRQNSQQLTNL